MNIEYGLGNYNNINDKSILVYREKILKEQNKKIVNLNHYYDMNFLSKDKIDEINFKFSKMELEPTRTKGNFFGNTHNEKINFDVNRFTDKDDVCYSDEIINRSMELNNKHFKLDIDGMFRFNYLTYTGENENHVDWHMDENIFYDVPDDVTLPNDLKCRKLTLVLMLSSHEEYEGGEFLFYNFSESPTEYPICSFKMDKGEAIIFPSFAMHKVNPVISGKRNTLVVWFTGPNWR